MAYLDGQLSPRETRAVDGHLNNCSLCREKLVRLSQDRETVTRLLAPYHRAAMNLVVSKARPWPPRASRITTEKGVVRWMRRYYKWIAAAAVVVLLLGYSPARGLASQFLSIFRVERVKVLHFDPADLAKLQEALYSQQELDIGNFGQVKTEPLEDTESPSAEESKLPRELGDYTLRNTRRDPGAVVEITPDVDSINDFLRKLGGQTLLPAELDGRTFRITIPTVLCARYESKKDHESEGVDQDITVYRATSPTLEVPEGVNLLAVRQALLDVPVLPSKLKRALEGIDDWTRTLPVPNFGGQAEEITFDGAPGLFVQGQAPPADGSYVSDPAGETYYGPSIIAWYRRGMWTVLEGTPEMSKNEAFALARQLEAAYGR